MELAQHQAMNFADEEAYRVATEGRAFYWSQIEGHAEMMRVAIEDHPGHDLSDAEDCSICRESES